MKFRLGSTSYIYPADILPNVQRLAGIVEDVELVLFEVADASNLPDAHTISELRRIARVYGMTYTVHLPTDLELGARGRKWIQSVEKARQVIERTRPLEPWAYIIHLTPCRTGDQSSWERMSTEALKLLSEETGNPEVLAVENLENCPLEHVSPILDQIPVSLCLDVGHLWMAGADPLPILQTHLKRARVLHLHGVNQRDHASLLWAPIDSLRASLAEVVRQEFEGVITLEVFSAEDFFPSLNLVLSLLEGIERWDQK